MEDVIIVGGGLLSLATAYYLKKQNIGFKVLEAQKRLGGGIETIYGNDETPMEMGATWFGKEHKNLTAAGIQKLNSKNLKLHFKGLLKSRGYFTSGL